jgi:aquaporin Z
MTNASPQAVAAMPRAAIGIRWHVYAIEAALLGTFMLAACAAVALLAHPASSLAHAIPSDFVRRALIGLAMGTTAICLIYSPFGKRSGAIMNPAMTLCFLRLGRLSRVDAIGYSAAQVAGGTIGVALAATLAPTWVKDPAVNHVVTVPGEYGMLAAWLGEFGIAFLLLCVVLGINRFPRLRPFTGVAAGMLVANFITFEAPLSGMSLNPARTFASAFSAGIWSGWLIYLSATPAGMLTAVEIYRRLGNRQFPTCGKLTHGDCHIKCDCV